jgi:hypothetical protein
MSRRDTSTASAARFAALQRRMTTRPKGYQAPHPIPRAPIKIRGVELLLAVAIGQLLFGLFDGGHVVMMLVGGRP